MPVLASDPSAELQAAVIAALRADATVQAAASGDPVRALDTPPTNTHGHYVIVSTHMLSLPGTDAADTEVTLDIWSLTVPAGKTVAMKIGAAAMAAVLGLTELTSHLIKAAEPGDALYVTDRADGQTAHGIVKLSVTTQPKPQP